MNNQAQLALEVNNLSRYRTNHVLHLILSIFTCGIWIPIWLLMVINNFLARSSATRKIKSLGGK